MKYIALWLKKIDITIKRFVKYNIPDIEFCAT